MLGAVAFKATWRAYQARAPQDIEEHTRQRKADGATGDASPADPG